MTSIGSKYVLFVLKLLNYKNRLLVKIKTGFDKTESCPKPPQEMYRNFDIKNHESDGCRVYTIRRKNNLQNVSILYFHGGAYVRNFNIRHWKFLAYLAAETGAAITAVDYPLAPDFKHKETFEKIMRLYLQWKQDAGMDKAILMGDSSGAGLAFGLNMHAAVVSAPLPDAVIAISPWLDVTMENPDIAKLQKRDPFSSGEALRLCGESYAGDTGTKAYTISPMFGNTANLAPSYLFGGTREILYPDFVKFCALLNESGTECHQYAYKGMFHDFVMFDFPEAKRAKQEIAGIVTGIVSQTVNSENSCSLSLNLTYSDLTYE